MRDSKYFPVLYMFVVTAFFSFLLIGISRGTDKRVRMNQQLSFEKAVLAVFPDITYKNDTEAHTIFTKQFEKKDDMGYLYTKDGTIQGYALPIAGKGFWAEIKGIVGVAKDARTITGVYFYEQSETPGLGARITEPFFYTQFAGKKLQTEGSPIEMRSAGQTLNEGQVHAISGATQTCVRLEKFMNEDLRAWMQAIKKETD